MDTRHLTTFFTKKKSHMTNQKQVWKKNLDPDDQQQMCMICGIKVESKNDLVSHTASHLFCNFSCRSCFKDVNGSVQQAIDHISECSMKTSEELEDSRYEAFKVYKTLSSIPPKHSFGRLYEALHFIIYKDAARKVLKDKEGQSEQNLFTVKKDFMVKKKIHLSAKRQIKIFNNSALFARVKAKTIPMSRRTGKRDEIPVYEHASTGQAKPQNLKNKLKIPVMREREPGKISDSEELLKN